jgi:uncharacterized membrane protein YdjX (TVP38/TMEM64 family)
MLLLRRVVPLAVLFIVLAAVWTSGLAGHLNWSTLSRHHAVIAAWISRHQAIAPIAFATLYAAATALSVPEAALLTLIGGLLFGTWLGGTLAVIGSTTGATILFLAARSAFADALARRGGSRVARVRAELHHNGFSYLLAIRLIPAFPFWLVNLAAALAGMRISPFATATLIGIIPGTFIYASIGAGLAKVVTAGQRPDLTELLSPHILIPLVALGVLALAPVAWRKWKQRNG